MQTLEVALEDEWNQCSAESDSLPEALVDPLKVMERGGALLTQGLRFPRAQSSRLSGADEEFRMAARNGKTIPSDVKLRMHADRQLAESGVVVESDDLY